jgi:hypothetical protein
MTWFMVLCDVISAVTEFMAISLQCCDMVYDSSKRSAVYVVAGAIFANL